MNERCRPGRLRPYAFDERCYELAEYFLSERSKQLSHEAELQELAQRFQECAEDYCQEVESSSETVTPEHG